jgi:DNA repair protein SbcD/Mre11
MGKESFRFIHASDFHLERPLLDLPDLPDHLRTSLIDAPWKAAESIFEQAVVDNVDFILLCGDLLNPIATGAAGPAFVLDHFEELNRHKIAVYWAGGQVDDPERWPEAVALPANVHLFSKRQVEQVSFRRNGLPVATIVGRSCDGRESVRGAEYRTEPDDNFVIALGHGLADAETLVGERVDYWALGGNHQRQVIQSESPQIRYCGAPQGRALDEPGAHGFYSVEVDAQRNVQVHAVDCDTFRYSDQVVDAEDLALGRDLRQLLAKRINKLQSDAAGRHTLVRWRIQMDLENASMVGPSVLEELLQWLRREFGHGQPCVWSTEIEVLPPKSLPKKWQEEDTILGDFLRTSNNHRKNASKDLNLKPLVDAETPGSSFWQATLSPVDAAQQAAMLERATLLGVDMLRGHQFDLLATTRRFGGIPNNTTNS